MDIQTDGSPKDTEQLNIELHQNTIELALNILQSPYPRICKTVLMSFYIWNLSIRKFWHLQGVFEQNSCQDTKGLLHN